VDRPGAPYFLYNTARQLTDMQVENRFGAEGFRPPTSFVIKSPYPFRPPTSITRRG